MLARSLLLPLLLVSSLSPASLLVLTDLLPPATVARFLLLDLVPSSSSLDELGGSSSWFPSLSCAVDDPPDLGSGSPLCLLLPFFLLSPELVLVFVEVEDVVLGVVPLLDSLCTMEGGLRAPLPDDDVPSRSRVAVRGELAASLEEGPGSRDGLLTV